MSLRSQRIANGIARLSASTYIIDCPQMVREYLKSVGHSRSNIGATPVFVLRRKNRVVRVAGSPEELQQPDSAPGSTRHGGVESVTAWGLQ